MRPDPPIQHVLLGRDGLPGELSIPPGAGALAIIVNAHSHERRDPARRAFAQALQEHELCTLSFSLRNAYEERHDDHGLAPDAITARIGEVLDWLSRRPALAHRRVALVCPPAHGEACAAAARLFPAQVDMLVPLTPEIEAAIRSQPAAAAQQVADWIAGQPPAFSAAPVRRRKLAA